MHNTQEIQFVVHSILQLLYNCIIYTLQLFHYWSYNNCFDLTNDIIMFAYISSSHLDFHENF